MVKSFTRILFIVLSLSAAFSCKKEEETTPTRPFPVDTLTADQYVVCDVDTVRFYTYTRDGGPGEIRILENSSVVTKMKFATSFFLGSQALTRNLELHIYDFKSRKPGIYTGARIFSKGRMDVVQNKAELLEKNYTIFNSSTVGNQITITYSDSNFVKGVFNFRMRSDENNANFVDVKNGIFKIRIR
jgi:hypothetical protein